MISRQHVPATLLAVALLATALAACEGDVIENPPVSQGGAAGAAAKGGAAGASGNAAAGKAGSAGNATAGAGGTGGTAGSAGTNAGTGGAAGTGGTAGAAGSAGATAGNAGASGSAAGSAGQAGSAGAAGGPSCVPTAQPTGDGKKPLFVAKDGNDSNDGSIGAPLLLVSTALARIANDPQTPYHLYLSEGTYDAAVVLPDVDGLVIEGGYKRANDTWTRTCDSTARELAVLTATSAADNQPVVLAKDLIKGVSLIRLTVKTKDQGKKGELGKTGETLIGLFVKGPGSKLTLDDVSVIVGKGGDGGEGTPGGAPPVAACDGLNDCEDGGKGTDGKDGEAATAGTFGENGYTAGLGTTGTAGGKGKNGVKGADGDTVSCALSCPAVAKDDCKPPTAKPTIGPSSAGSGTCGCGESSRLPGQGAASGGGAVGVVVGAGATLLATAGRIETKGGGAAPDGGAFGPSVAATAGSIGAGAECFEGPTATCSWFQSAGKCVPGGTPVTLAGGAPGTKGGESGKSGKGGPGAGGQSFAIVKIGNAVVDFKSEPTYQVGPGGKSGTAGDAAKSGNVGPLVLSLDHLPLLIAILPMRTRPLFALLSLAAVAVAACTGDIVEPAAGGAAGKAGAGVAGQAAAGSGGKAGATSTAGAAGSGGEGGSAAGSGSSGNAGEAGTNAAGTGGSAGTTSAGGKAGSASGGGAAGSGGSAVCSEGFAPGTDGKTPIFVAKDGKDTNAGSEDAPLATVGAALALATKLVGKSAHLYLSEGTYDAPVVLPDVDGLVIEGGYKRANDTWTRTCDSTARELAVLTATSAADNQPVVLAKDLIKGVSLIRLTVKTKDQGKKGELGKTGETLIGLFVKGPGSKLTLDDVSVIVGKGGDGGEGAPGGAPPVAACDGLNDCEDGGKGTDGKDGEAATAGTFGENGYTAGLGTTGTAGGKGKNGVKGAAGSTKSCAISCPTVDEADCKPPTAKPTTGPVSGGEGSCGCGESSRLPGQGAASGGGAVGAVVGAGATLLTTAGRIETKGGGAGPDGGAFGPSVAATEGAKGTDKECVSGVAASCAWGNASTGCIPAGTPVDLAGGAPGTKGGESGKSGKGGPGAGGQSFAIVKIGNAVVDFKSEPTYQVGPGGKSGSAGDAAKSGNVGPLVISLYLLPFVIAPMRTSLASFPRRLLACLVASSATALFVTACAGDEFVAPAAQGGSAGTATAGAAGSSGKVGGAGNGNVAGKAGSAGASGVGGSASGGAGGGAGSTAVGGSAGAAGLAGASGAAGAGGGGTVPGGCSESSPKFRCIGTQVLQQCNPSTKLYETLKTCTATEQCNAATQACDTCKAGAPEPGGKCASEGAQRVCAADGKGYTETKSCPAGAAICKDNACQGCKAPTDCPAPAGVCQTAACTDAQCGFVNVPKGPPPGAPAANGCIAKVCDGLGALVDEIAPAGTTCGTDKRCDGTGACLPCLPAPGATEGSSATACADNLLCSSEDLSNQADALFVAPAPAGTDSNTGTAASPLTLAAALTKLAADKTKVRLYVAQGDYSGEWAALDMNHDVIVEGGIKRGEDASWRRDCASGASQRTVLSRAGSTGTTLAWAGTGSVELRSLRIKSGIGGQVPLGSANKAQSSIALAVYGAAKVRLVAVALEADVAETGATGTNGYAPGPSFATTCPAGTGLPGEAGAQTADQAVPDIFTPDGFVPGKGANGNSGTSGGNGLAPTTTERARTEYIDWCPASVPSGTSCNKFDDRSHIFVLPEGYIGCAGGGAVAGEGGGQGGGSFALFTGTVGEIELVASLLSAKTAGAGGPGAEAVLGTTGTTPKQAPAPLTDYLIVGGTCNANGSSGSATLCKRSLAGSVTFTAPPVQGGKGGNGGAASAGASGRGGPVVALVAGKTTKITTSTSSTLLVANPAPGGQAPGESPAAAGLLEKTHSY